MGETPLPSPTPPVEPVSGLREGDIIAGVDAENMARRTGVVVEVTGGPDETGKWTVSIECADTRKRTATVTRLYSVLWPMVG